MSIFGALERLLSEDLYPYRVPLSLLAIAFAAGVGVVAWRKGWFTRAAALGRRRPAPVALGVIAALALLVPAGNYLVAPLWTRVEVVEASPLEAEAYAREQASQPQPVIAAPGATKPPLPSPAPSDAPARVVSRGEWKGADDFHFARGHVLIVEVSPGRYVLRLEDFSVRNGPDLFVMLSPAPAGYGDGALKLGRLKGTDGAFNYEIPPGTNLDVFKSAVVWCEQFAVLFGSATLSKA